MQITTLFRLTPVEYIERFNTLSISRPERCSLCGAYHSFYAHGSYWRNILTDEFEERIPIARFYCKVCKTTASLLPSFVLPYFQYSLEFILAALRLIFLSAENYFNKLAALFRFYKRRFTNNLTLLEMFFRNQGWSDPSPPDKKEKTIKMVCMLTVPTAETLSQRFHQHNKRNFMAK